MKWKKSSEKLVNHFYQVMESFPEADLKKMFGYPCAFLNGNMFIGLHQENLVLRLEKDDRQKIIDSGRGSTFEPMQGKVMKEYVSLSESTLYDLQKIKKLIIQSIDYVKTLPVKKRKAK